MLLLSAMSACYWDKESVLYPHGICDTAAVTWRGTIQPIIQQQCAYVGCHAGSGASGGINLAGYTGVKAVADDGSLVGSVAHEGNYSEMPRNGAKLPDCQIGQIRIWVAAGAPEN